ncbi:MFS transporter [Halopenitus sp. POP-27]|uniref:MFS transporter n=1 Tax=Halopenitus sp. POP-27 TaxID=2994425 RepID=UPI0024692823|nr:MFS transporter [Halopenitus sp. POP-27]
MGLIGRLVAPIVGGDRRVIVLGSARMVGAIGNSFLIVVLPLYIASGVVNLEGLLGGQIGVGPASVPVTEPLLIGFVLSLFGFLNSLSQPWTGRLSDRAGARRPFILAGIALLGTASGLYVFATDYWTLVVLRAAQGLGAALTIPAVVALVNEYAAGADERGENFGVFNTFRLFGYGFGPILAGVVVEGGPYDLSGLGIETVLGRPAVIDGFDAAFLAACAGAYLSFALVYWLVHDTEESAKASDTDVSIRVFGDDRLLDPVFALGLATVAMGICVALFATLQNQINLRLDQAPIWFGVQFAAVTIANVVFQVPVGRAADRLGRRPFLLAGFVLLVPSTLLQGVVTTPTTMLAVRLLQGIAVAFAFPPSLAIAGDIASEGESGSTLSVLTMGFGLGVAIGPLTSGFLVEYGFIVPFAVGAALAVGALLAVVTQVEETLGVSA